MDNPRLVLTENAIKRHSKRLQKILKEHNVDCSLTASQNIFAKVIGLEDWHELNLLLKSSNGESSDDTLKLNNDDIADNILLKIVKNLDKKNNKVESCLDVLIKMSDKISSNIDLMIITNSSIGISTEYIKKSINEIKISLNDIESFLIKSNQTPIKKILETGIDISFGYTYKGINFSIYLTPIWQDNKKEISLTIRKHNQYSLSINEAVHSKELLENPNILYPSTGLIIIGGLSSSGKSTTIHSILKHRVEEQKEKLVTYESLFKYPFNSMTQKGIVIRNKIDNGDINLRSAFQRKPTSIYINEIYDSKTVDDVLLSSMTGHATYSTIRANSIKSVIQRVIRMFNKEDQYIKTNDFFSNINTIICNKSIVDINKRKMIVQEYLYFNQEMKDLLLKSYTEENMDFTLTLSLIDLFVKKYGVSFNKAIINAYKKNLIPIDTMINNIEDM